MNAIGQRWHPDLMGPIQRPIFDALVAGIQGEERVSRSMLVAGVEACVGANPKTVGSVLASMADFGLVRIVGKPQSTVRLTTLGERWLETQ